MNKLKKKLIDLFLISVRDDIDSWRLINPPSKSVCYKSAPVEGFYFQIYNNVLSITEIQIPQQITFCRYEKLIRFKHEINITFFKKFILTISIPINLRVFRSYLKIIKHIKNKELNNNGECISNFMCDAIEAYSDKYKKEIRKSKIDILNNK
jgi:hypothetical protein